MTITYREHELQAIEEARSEALESDPVARNISHHHFVSRSKGWRNGKQRVRRHWKEVDLVKYRGGGFTLWHRCPFDDWATEIGCEDGEELKRAITRGWMF